MVDLKKRLKNRVKPAGFYMNAEHEKKSKILDKIYNTLGTRLTVKDIKKDTAFKSVTQPWDKKALAAFVNRKRNKK